MQLWGLANVTSVRQAGGLGTQAVADVVVLSLKFVEQAGRLGTQEGFLKNYMASLFIHSFLIQPTNS